MQEYYSKDKIQITGIAMERGGKFKGRKTLEVGIIPMVTKSKQTFVNEVSKGKNTSVSSSVTGIWVRNCE